MFLICPLSVYSCPFYGVTEADLAAQLAEAKRQCEATGKAARVFRDFHYKTQDSWSRERREGKVNRGNERDESLPHIAG
jgi:hypothetical protein